MVCVDCGYTTTCAHENMTWVGQEIENVSTPIDTGNGTHVSLVSGYVWYECPDCGAFRSEDYEFDMREAPHEDHDLDGFCDDCGAETGACTHENFTVVGWSQTYDEVGIVDEVLHNIYTEYAPVIRCEDCGEEFVDRYNEYANYKYEGIYEMHTYDAGNMCTICGYTTDCTHENADIKRTPVDSWSSWNDDTARRAWDFSVPNFCIWAARTRRARRSSFAPIARRSKRWRRGASSSAPLISARIRPWGISPCRRRRTLRLDCALSVSASAGRSFSKRSFAHCSAPRPAASSASCFR